MAVDNVGKDVPVHLSRFFPYYKLSHIPMTPPETLVCAYEIAKKMGLRHVYVGNISIKDTEDTFCHKCGKKLVNRNRMFEVGYNKVKEGKCYSCGSKMSGVWKN